MRCRSKWVTGCLAGIVLFGMAARSSTDAFQQLIDATADPALKKKMVRFKEEGIERSVQLRYDPEDVITFAESLTGTPHKMGGYSAKGIDCSGLVRLSHAQVGVDLPHSSHGQARYGKVVHPDSELKRGDLVFFYGTYPTPHLVTHSGIYLGEGRFIHASASLGVIVSDMNTSDYWKSHYLFATRLVE